MFVISGATGRTGGVAARTLLGQGRKVRVLVRDAARGEAWRARGAEVAVARLEDPPALAAALAGAEGFYTLLPEEPISGFHAHRRRMAEAIAGAVRASRVPHVVFLSSAAGHLAAGNGPSADLHHAEHQLRAGDARVTVIRAAYLQDNVAAVLPAARHEGIYPSFFPADAAFPTVATVDVGRLAALCLVEPPTRSEIIDLLGPVVSARQIADALGAALGRSVRVVEIPPAAHIEALAGAGLPPEMAAAVAELFACLASGKVSPRGDRTLAGTTTVAETIAGLVAS